MRLLLSAVVGVAAVLTFACQSGSSELALSEQDARIQELEAKVAQLTKLETLDKRIAALEKRMGPEPVGVSRLSVTPAIETEVSKLRRDLDKLEYALYGFIGGASFSTDDIGDLKRRVSTLSSSVSLLELYSHSHR